MVLIFNKNIYVFSYFLSLQKHIYHHNVRRERTNNRCKIKHLIGVPKHRNTCCVSITPPNSLTITTIWGFPNGMKITMLFDLIIKVLLGRWFRNPVNSPVEVGSLSYYLQGLLHLRWCRMSSINSMVSFFLRGTEDL